ncbi:ABC transporter ATP-binding protein [Alteromonas sp. a30]|uniref:ABC transporter ATP-binding protein n=1 Tax=Alteromonas sp. a30 TaxID=2730917 RepID=UPI002281F20B|nr:sn-glycerol-3-phosphate ABC transporter ATP-binding protein UgpC [Alteromonas sp. a30]MCY7296719.1 sn-glycerol-3-phosphate ABC transporter ATP-binding protein UgpC [Alteromonas sp. a30]
MANLKITQLRKAYGDVEILKGIDLDINDHEFVVFVGPSGCGKSTLLRTIAGLEDVNSGHIYLDEHEITELAPAKRDLAMVFQSYALYPHMTVRKNMSFALDLAGVDKHSIDEKVKAAADILELTLLLDRKPKDLSGGQRQRVAIGRSIVRNPKIFLFDEPLSNLDAALRVQMRLELARLHRDLRATMIYVTHDQVEAMTLADKVVVLNQGQIEQVGAPIELYERPKNMFVAGFLGMPRMSFLDAKVKDVHSQSVDIELNNGTSLSLPIATQNLKSQSHVTLGIRPEHINLCEKESGDMQVTFDVAEHLGSDTYCYAKTHSGESLTIRENSETNVSAGESLGVRINTAKCHLFDQQGNAVGYAVDTEQ